MLVVSSAPWPPEKAAVPDAAMEDAPACTVNWKRKTKKTMRNNENKKKRRKEEEEKKKG